MEMLPFLIPYTMVNSYAQHKVHHTVLQGASTDYRNDQLVFVLVFLPPRWNLLH